ncbi:hypothetical protein ACRYCC_10220 [Actinomadura scrupuli]|uniref:hypothetical protein n=1 Tax=Actinomadura scrupuli TaxID=559629 RepID=UPI003D97A15E
MWIGTSAVLGGLVHCRSREEERPPLTRPGGPPGSLGREPRCVAQPSTHLRTIDSCFAQRLKKAGEQLGVQVTGGKGSTVAGQSPGCRPQRGQRHADRGDPP